MLTCELCGEELLLEEDMKTHLLLSHEENSLHCPLCSLSGVSYDELSFHVNAAHPETQNMTEDRTDDPAVQQHAPDVAKLQSSPELFTSTDGGGTGSSTSSPPVVKPKENNVEGSLTAARPKLQQNKKQSSDDGGGKDKRKRKCSPSKDFVMTPTTVSLGKSTEQIFFYTGVQLHRIHNIFGGFIENVFVGT